MNSGVTAKGYQKGLYVADSVEAVSTFCSRAIKAGARMGAIFGGMLLSGRRATELAASLLD